MLKRVWKISHKLTKQSAINIGALLAIESIVRESVIIESIAINLVLFVGFWLR